MRRLYSVLFPLVLGGFLLIPDLVEAQAGTAAAPAKKFDPPRISRIFTNFDTGEFPEGQTDQRSYEVSRGVESSINRGDILNVYRETPSAVPNGRPRRTFIGRMNIIESQVGYSIGVFDPNSEALAQPHIRYKIPMTRDIVVPRLIIDSGVLFDPGKFALKRGADQEFSKVAKFVENFTPSKLIIEGHTDADGDEESNQKLSEQRAQTVRDYLVTAYDFITPGMIDAIGYGEERPIVNNDTPENKMLNRRIEVVVWE